MSDPVPVFLLMRVSSMPIPGVNSKEFVAGCGCRCWLSVNGAATLAKRELRTSCMECLGETDESLMARLHTGDAAPVAGTRASLAREFGEGPVTQAYDRMGMPPERDVSEYNP